jgi:cytochrome oxidase Cu insertion factor (SCO1/SenC/PrrC family)
MEDAAVKKILWTTLLLAFCLLLPRPAVAQEGETAHTPGQTVAQGDTALAFTLEASDGTPRSLEDLKGKKNLVLVFFRGTW